MILVDVILYHITFEQLHVIEVNTDMFSLKRCVCSQFTNKLDTYKADSNRSKFRWLRLQELHLDMFMNVHVLEYDTGPSSSALGIYCFTAYSLSSAHDWSCRCTMVLQHRCKFRVNHRNILRYLMSVAARIS